MQKEKRATSAGNFHQIYNKKYCGYYNVAIYKTAACANGACFIKSFTVLLS